MVIVSPRCRLTTLLNSPPSASCSDPASCHFRNSCWAPIPEPDFDIIHIHNQNNILQYRQYPNRHFPIIDRRTPIGTRRTPTNYPDSASPPHRHIIHKTMDRSNADIKKHTPAPDAAFYLHAPRIVYILFISMN